MARLDTLPYDILDIIAAELALQEALVPGFACICKTTQHVFERQLFKKLYLDHRRIAHLEGYMTSHRFKAIRDIQYRVGRHREGSDAEYDDDNACHRLYTEEVNGLLLTLASLERRFDTTANVDLSIQDDRQRNAKRLETFLASHPHTRTSYTLFYVQAVATPANTEVCSTFLGDCLDFISRRAWMPRDESMGRDYAVAQLPRSITSFLLRSMTDLPETYVNIPCKPTATDFATTLTKLRTLTLVNVSLDLAQFFRMCKRNHHAELHGMTLRVQCILPDGRYYFPPVPEAVLQRYRETPDVARRIIFSRMWQDVGVPRIWQDVGVPRVNATLIEDAVIEASHAVTRMPQLEALSIGIDAGDNWLDGLGHRPRESHFTFYNRAVQQRRKGSSHDYDITWQANGLEPVSVDVKAAWREALSGSGQPLSIPIWPPEAIRTF